MDPGHIPRNRSVWPTLPVKITRRKKWPWIGIFKPADPHSQWDGCSGDVTQTCYTVLCQTRTQKMSTMTYSSQQQHWTFCSWHVPAIASQYPLCEATQDCVSVTMFIQWRDALSWLKASQIHHFFTYLHLPRYHLSFLSFFPIFLLQL